MPRVKDLKIAKSGALHSLIGQKIQAGGELRTLRGGTILRHAGQLYVYSEDLNAHVGVSVAGDGTEIAVSFRSLPSEPFRPEGVYRIAGEVMSVRVRLTGQLLLTDGSDAAYDRTAGPFACDGQEHSVLDGDTVPQGKEAYRADVYAAEILFSSGGMDAYAYAQGEVGVESVPRRFTAAAYVSPAGAGGATAEPTNPAYGQAVRFSAGETDRDTWRFTGWASGVKDLAYTVQAFGDVSDTALFADATRVVDFAFTLSADALGRLQVAGRSVQNRAEAFVIAAFDIRYLDAQGQEQSLRYEREIWLDGRVDTYVFEDSSVMEILSATVPQFGDLPEPFMVGAAEATVAS